MLGACLQLRLDIDHTHACMHAQPSSRAFQTITPMTKQDLHDAQLLYAKAVSDRESFETRTATAESQQANAASDLVRVREQALSDAARIRELQESVLALSQTVQELQPLAPLVMTLEAEKASLGERVERLEEALAAAQHQLEQSKGREANARSEVFEWVWVGGVVRAG